MSVPTPFKLRTNGLSISNSVNATAFNKVRNSYMNSVFPGNFNTTAANSSSSSNVTSKMNKSINAMTILTAVASLAMGFGPLVASLFKGKNSHKTENNANNANENNKVDTQAEELSDAAKNYKKASAEDKTYYGTILENEISQSEKDVEAKKSSLSGIESDIKNATSTMDSAKKFVQDQKGKIPQAKTAISSMASKIAGKKAELATMSPDDPRYCELESSISVAEEDKKKMEKDLEDLQASVTEKEKIVNEQTDIVNKKTTEQKQVETEIKKLESTIKKNKAILENTKSTKTNQETKPAERLEHVAKPLYT